jgi:ATP-dependent DNA ligase
LQQEFVVGGYRPGNNGMDALLVGYYTGGRLMFAGKVRAGFVPHVRRQLAARLKALHVEQCLFVNLPDSKKSRWGAGITAEEMREMQWVKPELVLQIRFVEWNAEGAAACGLRGRATGQTG